MDNPKFVSPEVQILVDEISGGLEKALQGYVGDNITADMIECIKHTAKTHIAAEYPQHNNLYCRAYADRNDPNHIQVDAFTLTKEMIVMPKDISLHNACNDRCDMFVGPCICGATHTARSWPDEQFDEIFRFLPSQDQSKVVLELMKGLDAD